MGQRPYWSSTMAGRSTSRSTCRGSPRCGRWCTSKRSTSTEVDGTTTPYRPALAGFDLAHDPDPDGDWVDRDGDPPGPAARVSGDRDHGAGPAGASGAGATRSFRLWTGPCNSGALPSRRGRSPRGQEQDPKRCAACTSCSGPTIGQPSRGRAASLFDLLSTYGIAIIDSEESLERFEATLTGVPDTLDRLTSRLAAAAGIPATVLLGEAPAGLNATGDSDVRNYYDRLQADRTSKIVPSSSGSSGSSSSARPARPVASSLPCGAHRLPPCGSRPHPRKDIEAKQAQTDKTLCRGEDPHRRRGPSIEVTHHERMGIDRGRRPTGRQHGPRRGVCLPADQGT